MSERAAEDLQAQLQQELDREHADRASYSAELTEVAARRRAEDALRDGDAGPGDDQAPVDPALTVLSDLSLPEAQRVEVLDRLGAAISRQDDFIEVLLRIVRDQGDGPDVRAKALQVLASAAFQVVRFKPHQQDYLDALRDLLTDPVPELREIATATLAQGHDPVAQQVLLAGLREEGALPVPRAQAIRLLAEDDHLDNLPWLQELYASAAEGDRQEAVRFMSSYPAAEDGLAEILRDRAETAEVRAQSGASLRQLAPGRFEQAAREIAADGTEDAQVRTASRNALELSADPETGAPG